MARQDLKKVGINTDDFDLPICHFESNEPVETNKCVTWCKRPCFHFLNFEFITNNCKDEGCSQENPCAICLGKIDDQKIWIKMVIACYTPFVHNHKNQHKPPPSRGRLRAAKGKLMRRKL